LDTEEDLDEACGIPEEGGRRAGETVLGFQVEVMEPDWLAWWQQERRRGARSRWKFPTARVHESGEPDSALVSAWGM
jgi:hypothetical protein